MTHTLPYYSYHSQGPFKPLVRGVRLGVGSPWERQKVQQTLGPENMDAHHVLVQALLYYTKKAACLARGKKVKFEGSWVRDEADAVLPKTLRDYICNEENGWMKEPMNFPSPWKQLRYRCGLGAADRSSACAIQENLNWSQNLVIINRPESAWVPSYLCCVLQVNNAIAYGISPFPHALLVLCQPDTN